MSAVAALVEHAFAQATNASGVQRSAYVFVSNGATVKRLGGSRSVLHPGFGAEWRHPRGLGLGFEAGPRFEDYNFTRLDDLMLSVDVSYHVSSSAGARKTVPFLIGGYSLGWEPVSDGQQTSFFQLGGGATYRLSDQRGLRFELRDTVTLGTPQTGYHYVGFRVGYSWLMGRTK